MTSSSPESTVSETMSSGPRIPIDVAAGVIACAIASFFYAFSGEDLRDWIWPRSLAQFLGVAGILLVLRGLSPAGRTRSVPILPRALRGRAALRRGDSDVLLFALFVVAYAGLMNLLGFWLLTFIVVAFGSMALDLEPTRRKRVVSVISALAVTVVGYIIFEIVFYVPFPGTPGLPF
jgi:hypothetical protein